MGPPKSQKSKTSPNSLAEACDPVSAKLVSFRPQICVAYISTVVQELILLEIRAKRDAVSSAFLHFRICLDIISVSHEQTSRGRKLKLQMKALCFRTSFTGRGEKIYCRDMESLKDSTSLLDPSSLDLKLLSLCLA